MQQVLVDGKVVVRDRRLTTIDEDAIYDAIEAVMPGFRKDFPTITESVAKLQPWLDKAHMQIMGRPSTSTGCRRVADCRAKQAHICYCAILFWKWRDLGGLLM